nr:flippase [uncultured Romboutsia sp.]
MRKSNVKVNYIYNMIYKILTLLTPLITTPYISRVLGVENIGIYNYTYSVLSYFVLFGVLGFQMYGQREISYCLDNKEMINEKFSNIFYSRVFTVSITLLIYLIFSFFSKYRFIYLIFSIELISNAIDISWYYYGTEKFKKITIRNIFIKLIGITCIFLFVKSSSDLNVYIFFHVIVLFIGNLALWIGLKHNVELQRIKVKKCFCHFKIAILFFLPQCIDSIYMLMDKIMLGNLSNMYSVGIYGQADKIVKMVVTIITSLGLVISPKIAQNYKVGNIENIKRYMYKSFNFVIILALPMILGIISIADPFSNWFFGEGYDGVANIMSMLSIIILFMGLNSIMGWQYLMTVGRERDFIKSVSLGAIVNFILNYILIQNFNALGAVIASIISMFIMSIVNFYFIKNIIDVKKVLFMFPKALMSSLIMFFLIKFMQYFFKTSILFVMIEVIIGIGIYGEMMIMLKDDLTYECYESLLKRLTKKIK